jgi:hypothetical protein
MRKRFIRPVFGFSLFIIITRLFGATLGAPFMVAPSTTEQLPQYFPEVIHSSNAGCWLAVWQDGKATGFETARNGRAQDIFAARIANDGSLLDSQGIEVSIAADFQERPAVASDGQNFFVVWHDMRNGKDWDLYGARVSSDGTVLDPNGILISGGTHNQCFGDIVYGGGYYYVVWLDARNFPEYRIYGTRISVNGVVQEASGTELVRVMSDAEVTAWAAAPFAPGKKGSAGWHYHEKQPGIPTLATNGRLHVVTFMQNAGAREGLGDDWEEYYTQNIDPVTGGKTGNLQTFPVKGTLYAATSAIRPTLVVFKTRMSLVSLGENSGFIGTTFAYNHSFGSDGTGVWVVSTISDIGTPSTEMPRTIFREDSLAEGQSWNGYRTHGTRPNTSALACDGENVVAVFNRFKQTYYNAGNWRPMPHAHIDIVAQVMDTAGTVTDTLSCLSIADGTALQDSPVISSGPKGKFLVLWQEESLTERARIKGRFVEIQ